MLTVKLLQNDGTERIICGTETAVSNSGTKKKLVVTQQGQNEDGVWEDINLVFDDGLAYVMNQNGRTVGTYELG